MRKVTKKVWPIIKNGWLFLSSFVALAASVATCYTIVEMRKERNQAYKPYFVIETARYEEQFEKPFYGIYDSNNLVHLLSNQEPIPMELCIDNIGADTATDIQVLFSCKEYKDYWNAVCQYYDEDEVEIAEDYVKVKCYLALSEEIVQLKYNINKEDLAVKVPYIFSREHTKIPIPEEYCRLFSAIAYCTNGDYEQLPKLELEISFKDLQGINYHSTFKLSVDIDMDTQSDETFNYVNYTIRQVE